MSGTKRKILVLARRDHLEAMRVAAGMTIFGHEVKFVFMDRAVTPEIATSEQAELLELAGIEPRTTVDEMSDLLPFVDAEQLAGLIGWSESVVSL